MDSGEKRKLQQIFFDIEKVNRDKTLKQLENMGIQGSMMEFIRN